MAGTGHASWALVRRPLCRPWCHSTLETPPGTLGPANKHMERSLGGAMAVDVCVVEWECSGKALTSRVAYGRDWPCFLGSGAASLVPPLVPLIVPCMKSVWVELAVVVDRGSPNHGSVARSDPLVCEAHTTQLVATTPIAPCCGKRWDYQKY